MSESGKASAKAHPIQGLVKYHGLIDTKRRLPYHDSISLATAPIHTHTTVSVLDRKSGDDEGSIDEKPLTGRPLERVRDVLDAIRELAGETRRAQVTSRNDFPAEVGLGSSASGFAALAKAAADAYGLDIDAQRLSAIARSGAGSATRSVTGWISQWDAARDDNPDSSVSHVLPGGDQIPLVTLAALIPCDEPTEGVHRHVLASPFFQARLDYLPGVLGTMRGAVEKGDIPTIGRIAEQDTLNLHAVTMTGDPARITWRPATVAVMHEVRRLREEDAVDCWFSIDTGATVYVNTTKQHESRVQKALGALEGIDQLLRLEPGPGARLVRTHLA
jgi:phosphomevalonate decarboxylase